MKVSRTEDLTVFQKAHQMTLELYKITNNFPASEKWGLTSQIRRAAASICSNLLEGSHRNNRLEYRQFTGIANGSAGELKYHLLLARDLGYLKEDEFAGFKITSDDICKMLRGLIKSLT
jgi:four helix bundle protein